MINTSNLIHVCSTSTCTVKPVLEFAEAYESMCRQNEARLHEARMHELHEERGSEDARVEISGRHCTHNDVDVST